MNIALIDYRAGNLTSVRKALGAVGAEVYTPEQADDLQKADGIIVPGVGHFNVTATLDAPWREAVRAHVVDRKRPLLGICLGLQWLFEGSEEAPDLPGMGLLPGRCHLLRAPGLKVPHVGWNTLDTVTAGAVAEGTATAVEGAAAPRVLRDVPDQAYAYFTHSYVAPVTDACVATSTHGQTFAAVVERGLVMGAQFHPEKSGDVGLAILRNFVTLAEECR
jgi:imidazole glycerol-phosphate synthase subunit HisH